MPREDEATLLTALDPMCENRSGVGDRHDHASRCYRHLLAATTLLRGTNDGVKILLTARIGTLKMKLAKRELLALQDLTKGRLRKYRQAYAVSASSTFQQPDDLSPHLNAWAIQRLALLERY